MLYIHAHGWYIVQNGDGAYAQRTAGSDCTPAIDSAGGVLTVGTDDFNITSAYNNESYSQIR